MASEEQQPQSSLTYPEPAPLDQDLLAVLKETCKSYKTFIRDLCKSMAKAKAEGRGEAVREVLDRDLPIRTWLLYLLLLGYDVGFITLAIIRENLDRQLLTMRRQAFEYAVRAQYLVRCPEKAEQQYRALPLKLQDMLNKLSSQNVRFAEHEIRVLLAEEIANLPPGAGPKYGDVSMFEMVRALYPKDYQTIYISNYALPSTVVHGTRVGMIDALQRLGDGRLWMSHHSLTTARTKNVMVITESLIRILLITGDRYGLLGTHWLKLVVASNNIAARLTGSTETLDLPIDSERLLKAAQYRPPDAAVAGTEDEHGTKL